MALPVLLCPFGSKPGDDWFRTAYNYDRDQIFDWLGAVSRGEKGGPRAKIAEVQAELKKALDTLEDLSLPTGYYYEEQEPKEHFARQLDPDFDKSKAKNRSKFILLEWSGFDRMGSGGSTVLMPYWSPYDLLGYFLSMLGPAPQGAFRNNYFLPLTAVYARWCSRIAGHLQGDRTEGHGGGDWPFMFQCTWYRETDIKKAGKYFTLGASLAGSQWLGYQVGNGWRERVGKRRFDLLVKNQPLTLIKDGDWAAKNAPEQQGGSGTAWGNCAETYPFIEQMRNDKTLNRNNLYGLALRRHFLVYEDEPYDGYFDGKIWKNVQSPCGNCEELVKRGGAKSTQFKWSYDKYLAPKRPKTGPEAEVQVAAEGNEEGEVASKVGVVAADGRAISVGARVAAV